MRCGVCGQRPVTPSLRALASTPEAVGRLNHNALHDTLTGRRLPSEQLLRAFTAACHAGGCLISGDLPVDIVQHAQVYMFSRDLHDHRFGFFPRRLRNAAPADCHLSRVKGVVRVVQRRVSRGLTAVMPGAPAGDRDKRR
ncbi:hypothetical protein [Streptomyces sp. NBC_01579]|uniref:hypothetical protein n=1 Tax=Streptomyces sp. NBC_01579 TaxID=2975885 RepID=UPI003863C36A